MDDANENVNDNVNDNTNEAAQLGDTEEGEETDDNEENVSYEDEDDKGEDDEQINSMIRNVNSNSPFLLTQPDGQVCIVVTENGMENSENLKRIISTLNKSTVDIDDGPGHDSENLDNSKPDYEHENISELISESEKEKMKEEQCNALLESINNQIADFKPVKRQKYKSSIMSNLASSIARKSLVNDPIKLESLNTPMKFDSSENEFDDKFSTMNKNSSALMSSTSAGISNKIHFGDGVKHIRIMNVSDENTIDSHAHEILDSNTYDSKYDDVEEDVTISEVNELPNYLGASSSASKTNDNSEAPETRVTKNGVGYKYEYNQISRSSENSIPVPRCRGRPRKQILPPSSPTKPKSAEDLLDIEFEPPPVPEVPIIPLTRRGRKRKIRQFPDSVMDDEMKQIYGLKDEKVSDDESRQTFQYEFNEDNDRDDDYVANSEVEFDDDDDDDDDEDDEEDMNEDFDENEYTLPKKRGRKSKNINQHPVITKQMLFMELSKKIMMKELSQKSRSDETATINTSSVDLEELRNDFENNNSSRLTSEVEEGDMNPEQLEIIRKAEHNKVERRRRDRINNYIYELHKILPTKERLYNSKSKGAILRSVYEHYKKQCEAYRMLKERYRIIASQMRAKDLRIRELENEKETLYDRLSFINQTISSMGVNTRKTKLAYLNWQEPPARRYFNSGHWDRDPDGFDAEFSEQQQR